MDVNERTSEVVNIFKKLKELNLGISNFEEFNEFRKICNEFICHIKNLIKKKKISIYF